MLVVLDGPDGVGKTTAVREIVGRLDALEIDHSTFHFGHPDDKKNTDFKTALLTHSFNVGKGHISIWDRGFASRWIYTRHYPLNENDTQNLIRLFKAVHQRYEDMFRVKVMLNTKEWRRAEEITRQPDIFSVDREKIWRLFNEYADRFDGWHRVEAHTPDTTDNIFDIIMDAYNTRNRN